MEKLNERFVTGVIGMGEDGAAGATGERKNSGVAAPTINGYRR
jgi:hypothetical protein